MAEYNGPLEVDGKQVSDGTAPMRTSIGGVESVGHDLRGGSAYYIDGTGMHPLEPGYSRVTHDGHTVEHLEESSGGSN
jgi:hypothetical protein